MVFCPKKWCLYAGGLVLAVVLMSCTTMADFDFSAIDQSVGRSDYAAVYADISANQDKLYSKHDIVLEDLDKGIVSHYAGEAERSNRELSEAEQKINEYYSKSISQTISSFIVNDTVRDYSGETYEDIYTNIFKGLNYLALDDFDDAFVEIRRFDNKLKELTVRNQAQLAAARQEMTSGADAVPGVNLKFHNSALARYISMLMYRADGNPDDARIDYKKIKEAFAFQPELYDFPVPQSTDGDIQIPKGQGRLNVISFSGAAPVKVENVLRVNLGSTYYKLALPEMKKRKSRVVGADVTVISRKDGSMNTVQLEKIESIEDIALDTYQQQYALIFAKTLARSIAKAAATAALNDRSNDNGVAGGLFSLLSLASAVTTEATERADVRTSRYFPASASVTGITLAPGMYDVTVRYFGPGNVPVADRSFSGVSVTEGKLNLVESVCLQ